MRGHPIASHMEKLVELHREGTLELDPELVAAQEAVERVDASALAVREQAVAARERVHELEVGMTGRLLAAAKSGTDALAVAVELEDLEGNARRSDRITAYFEDCREAVRMDLGAFAAEDETWAAMDRALQAALDRAANAFEKLPADVGSFEDLRRRNLTGPALTKARDTVNALEDSYSAYGAIRRAAENLAVLCFQSERGRFPGDNLSALTFVFRTGFRVVNHNRVKWPEGAIPFLRYIVEHREELGPWIPNEDAWRAACEAALDELVPPEARALQDAWSASWR